MQNQNRFRVEEVLHNDMIRHKETQTARNTNCKKPLTENQLPLLHSLREPCKILNNICFSCVVMIDVAKDCAQILVC